MEIYNRSWQTGHKSTTRKYLEQRPEAGSSGHQAPSPRQPVGKNYMRPWAARFEACSINLYESDATARACGVHQIIKIFVRTYRGAPRFARRATICSASALNSGVRRASPVTAVLTRAASAASVGGAFLLLRSFKTFRILTDNPSLATSSSFSSASKSSADPNR